MLFEKLIIEPFLQAIENNKSKNAFCINEKFYTYGEFSEFISKIRTELKSKDLKNKNIGLVVNDDIETYASIPALWLEGLAYVPLHPKQPYERSIEIAKDAEVELIIDSNSDSKFTDYQIIESSKLKFEKPDLNYKLKPDDDLAYILFTSGSTGKPKGVQISRLNLASFVKAFLEVGFDLNCNDKCLQCFDLTFDVSVQSFLIPLLKGACVYTVPHDQIKYSYVYGLLEEHNLTFGAMAPSMIRYLRPYFEEINLPEMRYNILTAEASTLELLLEWSKCVPNAEIYDFYGPTEATTYCTYNKLKRNDNNKQYNGLFSIGKPLIGIDAIITDENGAVAENNKPGELCISGNQLTKGYWKSNEMNKKAFFEKEINGNKKRFYRTGDLCMIDDEGDIMYSGRLDNQVKIQGFRVELGEIEHHARLFLKKNNAVAIAFENNTGNTELALFIESEIININNLLDYLKSKIPSYMVPTKIILENKFPLNENGKLDRNLLKKNLLK